MDIINNQSETFNVYLLKEYEENKLKKDSNAPYHSMKIFSSRKEDWLLSHNIQFNELFNGCLLLM